MIVAIYARKSTDQGGVADEAKSVTRQVDHARAYAARKGWTVEDAYVFVDDGVSGAEFERRPGFLRLMNVLKPRAPFQVLIVSELSRLGRESLETGYALKQLSQAGVTVFSYMDDREVVLDSAIDVFMLQAANFAATIEREKAAQRSRDKALQLALAGHVTGGRVFGYDLVDVMQDGTERRRLVNDKRHPAASHVALAVNEDEAAVVRRIFELAAAGMGQSSIAKRLNLEGALTPMPRQKERSASWATSSVHEVLFRTKYRGEIVWNQTKKRDRWGQHHPSDRQRAEWVTAPAPHLRIVSDALWEAAHARIASDRHRTNTIIGRKHSKYLLPGLSRCVWCNGGLHVRFRTRAGGRMDRFYACTNHWHRGDSICTNRLQLPMADIDRAVLAKINDLVTPDVASEVIAGVREAMMPNRRDSVREQILEEEAAAAREVANLAEAIAGGGNIPALVARLREAEERRQRLAQRAEQLDGGPVPARIDWRALERRARALLQDWRALLARNADQARPVLRELLATPLRFTPIIEDRRQGVTFAGSLAIGGILAGQFGLASPGGVEPPA